MSASTTPLRSALLSALEAAKAADSAYYDNDDAAAEGPEWVAVQAAEAAVDRARHALLHSDEERPYWFRSGADGYREAVCCRPSELATEVDVWGRSGSWGDDNGYESGAITWWHDVYVTCEEDGTDDKYTIAIDPSEPRCVTSTTEHDWRSPISVVGGIKENPGVFGSGGGVKITEVCKHCGAYKHTNTWAQRRDTGEQGLTSVSYEDADERSREWITL